jgi:hypothetical protein
LVHAAPATTSTDVVAANKRALSEVEPAVSRRSAVASAVSAEIPGKHTPLACWFENLAVASRPLQRRLAETDLLDGNADATRAHDCTNNAANIAGALGFHQNRVVGFPRPTRKEARGLSP